MLIEEKIQYLMDRKEIEDKCILYAHIIDTKSFSRLNEVFTDDCYIDYSASGGNAGDLEETISFLEKSMTKFRSMHLVSNIMIDISSDNKSAKGRVMLHNPMTLSLGDSNKDTTFWCGLWYLDEWVNTENGWFIKKRTQEYSYIHNSPFHK